MSFLKFLSKRKENQINCIIYQLGVGIVYCDLCKKAFRKLNIENFDMYCIEKENGHERYIDFEKYRKQGYCSSRFENVYKLCYKNIRNNSFSTFPRNCVLCLDCYGYIRNEEFIISGLYDIKLFWNTFVNTQIWHGKFRSFYNLMSRKVCRWIRNLSRRWWSKCGVKIRLWMYSNTFRARI